MSSHGDGIAAVDRRPLFDRRVVHFLRHLGEMFLAMMIGMAVLGWPLGGVLEAVLAGALRSAEVSALAMAFSMTIPMAAWMRHRGHGWRATVEMSAAMVLPAIALLAALRLDAVSGATMLSAQHALMLPSMLAAMLYRRSEYLG